MYTLEGVPLPDGMDALWQEDIVNADGNGIMGVTDTGIAAESDSEDNRNLGMRRDSERFFVGSDGSIYYTLITMIPSSKFSRRSNNVKTYSKNKHFAVFFFC